MEQEIASDAAGLEAAADRAAAAGDRAGARALLTQAAAAGPDRAQKKTAGLSARRQSFVPPST